MSGSPLALDPESMRRLGYRTVDMLVDRITGPAGPVVQEAAPAELRARLAAAPPEAPVGFEELLGRLERDVLPFVARISHPGYLAFIPGEGTWPGALGDLIGSALNVDTCWWLGASGPSALELAVLDWIRGWVGYPEHAAGVLVSGGSAANLTALACAREARIGPMDAQAIVYMSDQAHSSLARAARALGFRPDQVRIIPTDERGRLRPEALGSAVAADEAAGLTPLAMVANAGTTATGAVDPFAELARLCGDHGIWLHVDGAYGAFACLAERGREALAGMELADSITLDPHKWLYQPIELGCLLVRDGAALRHGFEISPDYLSDVEVADQEVNFSDLGLQLTRSCRALKLWISLSYFGVAAFRAAIDTCLDLTQHAQREITACAELELMTPASLGVVTFRRHPRGVDDEAQLDRLNASVAEQIQRQGEVFLSTARVGGRLVLRLCILNHSTSRLEVDRAVEQAATLPVDGVAAPVAPREELSADLGRLAAAPVHRRGGAPDAAAVRRAGCRGCPARPRASTTRSPARRSSSSGRSAATSTSCSTARSRSSWTAPRWPRPAPATSSASSPRSTGEPASDAPARPPSPRPVRRGCSCSTGRSSTGS